MKERNCNFITLSIFYLFKSYNFIEIIEFQLYYLSFHVRVRNLETLDKMEVSNKFKEFVKS